MLKNIKLSYLQIIFLILLLSLFLRFYNLPESFIFAGDEEYQATLAESIVVDFHIIWIGVNAAHLGFYLGPYWTYFTSFWLWVSNGDPLLTGYISSFIGVLTTLLIIYTGSTLFNKKTGILAGLLYATLPLIVYFDQKYWNPTLVPFLSLLILLSLSKLKGNPLWAIPLSLGAGLIFHTHLSLFPLLLIAAFWFFREKIRLPKKILILSLITILLTLAPLLIFDYFHKGTNISTPLRFNEISSDPVNKVNPAHHFKALFQTLGRVWFLNPGGINSDEVITSCTSSSRLDASPLVDNISQRTTPTLALSIFGSFILLLFLFNKLTWRKDSSKLLALFILFIITSFLLFPGASYEYYLLGIFPLLLFLPIILTDYFPKFEYILFSAITVASILGIFTVLSNTPEFGLRTKESLIKQTISVIGEDSFELKQSGICHFYEGWRYLFVLNGKIPERSESDKSLSWLYPTEVSNKDVKYTIILSEARAPINFDIKDAQIVSSKGFKAYIFKNY